jgi:hypothetical protein
MAQTAAAARHDEHQTKQADNRYTRQIASFVSGLTYEKVPAEVRQRIKLLILDSIGCGIYGSIKSHSQLAIKGISAVDDSKLCGIWGTSQRVSAPHAALLNGTLVQGFELDDIKTKTVLARLGGWKAEGKVLVVLPSRDETVERSCRNLREVRVILADSLNVIDLLEADTVVFTRDALARAQEVYA